MVTDIFVEGAKKGWIYCDHLDECPAFTVAFVIIKALQITGALDLMGSVFAQSWRCLVAGCQTLQVLIGAWMSMGGAVGVDHRCLTRYLEWQSYCDHSASYLLDGLTGSIHGPYHGTNWYWRPLHSSDDRYFSVECVWCDVPNEHYSVA